jgi:stearoyl-CoA desaturase (delta-9 desaturase)
MDSKNQQLVVFYTVQICALLSLIFLTPNFYLMLLGWIVFCGFGSAVIMHRGLSHKSFNVKSWMAILACLTVQGSPLWWVATHRKHHAHTDTDKDVHSPNHGIFHSYFGWLHTDTTINPRYLKDYLRNNAIKTIDKYYVHIVLSAIILSLLFPPLIWFWLVPAAWSFHQEAIVNVVCHYKKLRNIRWLGYLTWGQSIHKNHHEKQNTFLFGPSDPCRIFTSLIN